MPLPPPPAPPRLLVEDLTVRYDARPALEEVSLRVERGSICALVGRNGAGKSTLFQAVLGFQQVAGGLVRLDGLPLQKALGEQRVAYVPQGEQVDWQFPIRVWDVVMMGRYGHMNLLRWPAHRDRVLTEEALVRVDLLPQRDRQIGELSGGQRKRAFLARAIAQHATLLLLDEPFAGVDVRTEELIIERLLELRQAGVGVLIATHDLKAVPRFCDRVVLLNRRVMASGPPAEVLTQANLLRSFSAGPSLPG